MISTTVLLNIALIITVLGCLQLLRRIGGGLEIITLSRTSGKDVETSWNTLIEEWERTGLTFTASAIHDSEEDGTRTVTAQNSVSALPIVMSLLPSPTPYSIVFNIRRIGSVYYPHGEEHFEHWRVESNGEGSRIVVETRFRLPLFSTVRSLLALRKQVAAIANGPLEPQASEPADNGKTKSAPQQARSAAPTSLPASYSREAMISVVAFAYLLTQYSVRSAIILAAVILWHEYGHLLAYRWTGKTGNRLMLVPLFGGIAVAGAPHKNQFEKAFCALMGPGICAPLSLGSFALYYYDLAPQYDGWLFGFMYFSSVLNLLNLLPIYPLDGGQTVEAGLRSSLSGPVNTHLIALAGISLVILTMLEYYQMAVFVGLFSLIGLRSLPVTSRLPGMSAIQGAGLSAFYALIAGIHGGVFYYVSQYLG